MEWQDKWRALISLTGTTADNYVGTDINGQWYVHLSGVEIADGAFLCSRTGRGDTPQLAIEKTWDDLAYLKSTEWIVVRANSDQRRCLRWNGFMWEDYSPPRRIA